MTEHVVVVIPARYQSSRFPGKPLVPLLGKPMIIWVAEIAAHAVGVENVFVATDDKSIAEVVQGAGFATVMTSSDALTGTDRVAEAAQKIKADIYINVQGDEPLVNPADIRRVIEAKKRLPDCVINGCCEIAEREDPESINIPKMVANEHGQLLYASRKAIPGSKDLAFGRPTYLKQVCIYAFSREQLLAFREFGRKSALESHEDIEILRFFELGVPIHLIPTEPGSLAVDVKADIDGVEAALRERHDR